MVLQEEKLINYLAIILTGSVAFQHLSTAVGNLFYIGAVLGFVYLLYYRKKHGYQVFYWDQALKGYYCAFGILFLTALPSAFCAGEPLRDVGLVSRLWFYRWLPFFIIPLCIRDCQVLIKMLIAFMGAIAVDSLVAGGQSLFWDMYRPNGFGGAPLLLAAFLCYCVPILTILVLDKRFDGWLSKSALLILICCLLALIVGNSRGAWLTLGIILPLISWTYIKNNKKYICIAGLICCLLGSLFALNPSYQNRLISITNTTTDRSNADRILVWRSATHMIEDHPLTGVGPKKFKPFYDEQYRLPQVTQDMLHSHNIFIEHTAEYGVIGLGGLLYFFFYLLKRSYYGLKKKNPYARMQLGSILGLLLFGMIDCMLNFSLIVRSFSFLLAILIVLSMIFDRENHI